MLVLLVFLVVVVGGTIALVMGMAVRSRRSTHHGRPPPP